MGRGSTATVFLARRADREVALKVRARGDPELDRRFLREFEALRGLAVPGVVRVHDAGLDDRWLWYAMDVVRGAPLRAWIEAAEGTAARVQRLLHVAPPLCDALAGVHRTGLVHRDLKPSNVLVDAHGLPHVLDFGVARAWVDGDPLTGEGGLVGTLPFMSPEQVAGQPLTGKSDLFAVGLMLYEGILGKRPRPARPHDWLRIQCLDRPRPLATLDAAVPLDVSAVLDRLLALDPRDRPDAAGAAALFRACAEGRGPREWPEPNAYVGNPPVLAWADAWLEGEGPRVLVLAGPTGSGRRRTAEHVRRRALLAGARTVRGRCRVERPGGAVEEVLEALLEAPADTEWRRRVGGGDTGPLLEMWPHLPLEPLPGPGTAFSAQDVARAASAALGRAAEG
ncbi:MAG: serine/threonine-protein kinase, partial [Myxococcota bacterium]